MEGKIISHYRLLSKIGEGATGVVYQAKDEILDRLVAVKILRPEILSHNSNLRTRLKREALTVSKINHQHIATIYEYGETDEGQAYLAMELADGQTLTEIIRSNNSTIENKIQIIKAVAEALEEAHVHGIIHRDIKPSNIALTKRGIVKVLDFGLAKQIANDGNTLTDTQTREGVILGTPYYLSPEQALGIAVDSRSDLFSLGCVLYECLTGRPPFVGNSSIEICAKIIRDDAVPPSHINSIIPPKLDYITLKALSKKPQERYQTAKELILDLNKIEPIYLSTETTEQHNLTSRLWQSAISPKESFQKTLGIIATNKKLSLRYLFFVSILTLTIGILSWTVLRALKNGTHQPSPTNLALFEEGEQNLFDGDYVKARDKLQQVVEADKDFIIARLRLAEVLWELNYTNDSAQQIEQIQKLNLNLGPIEKARLQAISDMTSNNLNGVVTNNEEIVRLIPDNDKGQAFLELAGAEMVKFK